MLLSWLMLEHNTSPPTIDNYVILEEAATAEITTEKKVYVGRMAVAVEHQATVWLLVEVEGFG